MIRKHKFVNILSHHETDKLMKKFQKLSVSIEFFDRARNFECVIFSKLKYNQLHCVECNYVDMIF